MTRLPARLVAAFATAGLLLTVSCPAPPPPRADACLEPAWNEVSSLWPTAGAALEDRDVYGRAVWYWAHQRGSVDGFGAVLATIAYKPDPRLLIRPPEDIKARARAENPSLLFFDQTEGPSDTWPIIGMGFHYDFDPCQRPALDCADPADFFVHEAGYHATPIGDGGMLVATPDDVKPGSTLDEAGCEVVRDEDLKSKFGRIKHGRAWVTHVWFPPPGDDSPPIWAVEDPWERWTDATQRSSVVGRAFFGQGDCTCDDTGVELPRRGCGG